MLTNLLRGACHGSDLLVKTCGRLAALLMPVLAAVVAYEVFSRYVLNAPTIWAFDLSLFMFGYIAALGGAYAQLQRTHITVDILYGKVSERFRSAFNLVSYLLAIFFLLVIVTQCLDMFFESIEFDYRRQSEWEPPMYHFWLMMVIAAGLFVLQLVRDLIVNLYQLITSRALLSSEVAHHVD